MRCVLPMKMKMSIRKRIVVITTLIVAIPMLILSVISEAASYRSVTDLSKNDMQTMTKLAANYVKADFSTYLALAESAGCNAMLSDSKVSDEEKLEIMTRLAKQYGAKRGNLVRSDGVEITQFQDFSDREYYIAAMKGESSIYEPTISRLTGEIIEIVAAPLWKDGVYGTEVVGCTYFITQPEYINDIMRELHVSDNCYAFILDAKGRVIAHSDSVNVLAEEYVVAEELTTPMLAGGTGTITYRDNGTRMQACYTPIANTNGWSLAVCARESDFLTRVYLANVLVIAIFVLFLITAIILTRRIAKRIANPITACADRLADVAKGDLHTEVPQINTGDETQVLADATETLVTNMQSIITDMSRMLAEMASGNFNVDTEIDAKAYCGDFEQLLEPMHTIRDTLRNVLRNISTASDNVTQGATNVSQSSANLSAISEELAASFNSMSVNVHTITEKLTLTAKNCEDGQKTVEQTAEYVRTAVDEMTEMNAAMDEISKASHEITQIIKTIEDIAFQTNILALNAAVEAARAGTAGKGFAVVADEVRNLANKSAEASATTAKLAEKTVVAVQNGLAIAEKTSESMRGVDNSTSTVKAIVTSIASASEEQSAMINQITDKFDNISDGIQQCADSAIQSAEAAHAMTEQADNLDNLVSKFKLD